MRYLPDPRVLKNADVEFSCLLRFRIESKKRIYLLHAIFPRRFSARAQVRAVLVTSAPSILAFACLFAFGAANLRGEQQKTGSA